MVSFSEIHIDQALTNMLVAYVQSDTTFVAGKVFPVVQAERNSGKYFSFDKDKLLRQYAKKRAPGGKVPRAEFNLSTDSYSVEQFAVGYPIPREYLKVADKVLSLEQAAMIFLRQQLLMQREQLFVTDFVKASVWATDLVGTTDFVKWSDSASTPIANVSNWKSTIQSNTGIVPNTLTVTKDVHDALRNNPDMLDRIQGGATTLNSALLTRKGIADLLELEYYNVIEAVTETANEGQTSNPDFMATKKLLLTYTNPSPAPIMQAPSAGYHFTTCKVGS